MSCRNDKDASPLKLFDIIILQHEQLIISNVAHFPELEILNLFKKRVILSKVNNRSLKCLQHKKIGILTHVLSITDLLHRRRVINVVIFR